MCKTVKKEGFTLIELVAALAIISILTVVFFPRFSKYVENAKKTRALEEVRQVVLAVEDYNISSGNSIKETTDFSVIKSKVSSEVFDLNSVDVIKDNMNYKTMEDLVNGRKNFKLNEGKIEITS